MIRYYIKIEVSFHADKYFKELQEYVNANYDRCVIDSDTNVDDMIADIQQKMTSLGQKYKIMKNVRISKTDKDFGFWLAVRPEDAFDDRYVLITAIKIRKTYAEGMIGKGGLK